MLGRATDDDDDDGDDDGLLIVIFIHRRLGAKLRHSNENNT